MHILIPFFLWDYAVRHSPLGMLCSCWCQTPTFVDRRSRTESPPRSPFLLQIALDCHNLSISLTKTPRNCHISLWCSAQFVSCLSLYSRRISGSPCLTPGLSVSQWSPLLTAGRQRGSSLFSCHSQLQFHPLWSSLGCQVRSTVRFKQPENIRIIRWWCRGCWLGWISDIESLLTDSRGGNDHLLKTTLFH